MLTLPEYWEQQIRRLTGSDSVYCDDSTSEVRCTDESMRRGTVEARLYFSEEMFLDVFERVVIGADEHPSRLQYHYDLLWGDERVEAWHFDSERPENQRHHRHVAGSNEHEPWQRVSLMQAVETSWSLFSEYHEGDEDDLIGS